MKAIVAVLGFIITVLSFSSCQKEITGEILKTDSSTTTLNNLIKTYTEDVTSSGSHTVTTYNLSYDAMERVTSMVSSSVPGDKTVYQYPTTGTFTMDIYNANVVSIHELFTINSMGYVDTTFQVNDTQDTTTEKYIYNAAKQLIQVKEYVVHNGVAALDNITNYTYDTNNNLIKEADNNLVTTYDYYTALTNNVNAGLVYFGSYSKNLVKTTTIVDGSTTHTLNHTYTFDNSNRITTETISSLSGEVVIKKYTY